MEEREFRTPRGRKVWLYCRPGTNDRDMAYSCLDEDEYGLRGVELGDGWAADVGSHIGMVAIGLLIDNPQAHVIAVEPIPENVEMIVRNADRNGVSDRLAIQHGAASRIKTNITIAWDFAGNETADVHRYVGNQPMPAGTKQQTLSVPGVTLASLTLRPLRLIVIDCEGGEYELFGNTTATGAKSKTQVAEIRGEYHDGFSRLVGLLDATHDVERLRGDDNVGGFVARLRA